ncbi:hypothetical protein BDZ97DRAFT_1917958 [Flammula alnicola]|nr:hypothetical protein BDZ97DRAFT_1917958 [Flammula alnicola]
MEKSYATSGSERPLSEDATSANMPPNEPANEGGNGNGNGIAGEGLDVAGGPVSAGRPGSELFLLVTFALGLIAWLISLLSQAVVAGTISDAPVRILWFGIIIQTILTFLVLQVITGTGSSTYDAAYAYGTQISVFAALATVFAVLGVDQNIYSSRGAQQATGAGWLLVAIVDLLWIFFFTSPPQSPVLQVPRSLMESRIRREQNRRSGVQKVSRSTDAFPMAPANGARRETDQFSQQPSVPPQDQKPTSPRWSGRRGTLTSIPSEREGEGSAVAHESGGAALEQRVSHPTQSSLQDAEAKWRAEAMFDYGGSASDTNELKFKKGEVLLIFDKSGKWWEAKKRDGQKGSA